MMLLKCIMIVASTVLGGAAGAELGQTLGIMNHAATGAPDFGGSKMERTFTKYVDLPVGEAALSAAGWTKNSICDPVIGHMWTQEGSAATKSEPLVLYTTKAGQMSGVGVHIYGELPEPQQRWITASTTNGANGYRIDVAFRKGSIICSGEKSDALIGDALTVNPGANGGESKELSLTQTGAEAAGWHRWSCFDGMGFHSFLDTSVGANKMSWKAKNLFPVVAMYHEGEVNAIFFASWTVQQGLFSHNQWEPVPLLDTAMCLNTCDSDCTFEGTSAWSTLHVFFRDHNLVKCDSSLSCTVPHMACCPKSNDIV
eukprot:NODE_1263_length_1189_cov_416.502646.p1 GENE.NODE_1263_length_1189_cov_416.502646~~NODE_1263_length_1189_cov_416.502646.p1  ORF type:complete len:313 (+),score=67.37 NODE_1263_length_1189_cov_416.502646:104-1042(+)